MPWCGSRRGAWKAWSRTPWASPCVSLCLLCGFVFGLLIVMSFVGCPGAPPSRLSDSYYTGAGGCPHRSHPMTSELYQRCGPNFVHASCPEEGGFCNEDSGWCGTSDAHKNAQPTTTYDFKYNCNGGPPPPVCTPCPLVCCDRGKCSSARELGDCETHGRFCGSCCHTTSAGMACDASTVATVEATSQRHGALTLPSLAPLSPKCNLSAGDVSCAECRCDCHMVRHEPWHWHGWVPRREGSKSSRTHAGGLVQCLNGPHRAEGLGRCDPTGIRIGDNESAKSTLMAVGCDWDVAESQCGGRGLAVPFPGHQESETFYRDQGHECFCNAGWRGSRCQLPANGGATRLRRCMAAANKTTLLFIGDSLTRKRYVALNRILDNHISEIPILNGPHQVSFGPLALMYGWLGTPFQNPMPAETGLINEQVAASSVVTLFNTHLWSAVKTKDQYCELLRRTERELLTRDVYGLRLFVGIEPVNYARLDDGRRSTWQNNSVFESEQVCVDGLLDGHVPMWDTIRSISTDMAPDGFHMSTEVADKQAVLIIDAVCAAVQKDNLIRRIRIPG